MGIGAVQCAPSNRLHSYQGNYSIQERREEKGAISLNNPLLNIVAIFNLMSSHLNRFVSKLLIV